MNLNTEILDKIADLILTEGVDVYTATEKAGNDRPFLTDEETDYVREKIADKPIEYDLDKIISCLQGTCSENIDSMMDSYYPGHDSNCLDSDQFNHIDQNVFLCDCCGWWCETGEANENPSGGSDICNDCYEEATYEEDAD